MARLQHYRHMSLTLGRGGQRTEGGRGAYGGRRDARADQLKRRSRRMDRGVVDLLERPMDGQTRWRRLTSTRACDAGGQTVGDALNVGELWERGCKCTRGCFDVSPGEEE